MTRTLGGSSGVVRPIKEDSEIHSKSTHAFPYRTFIPRKIIHDEAESVSDDLRLKTLLEIRDSERTFLTFLQSVVVLFYTPCKSSHGAIAPSDLVHDIFGNITEIAEISSQILQAFEVFIKLPDWQNYSIGQLFIDLAQGGLVRVYEQYVADHGKRMKALSNSPDSFVEFCKKTESGRLCGNHTLSSLLITPIQLVPRYILLIRELRNKTPLGHPDHELLTGAIEQFSEISRTLDETKKKLDVREQVASILSSLLKKVDGRLRKIIQIGDIEAHGPIYDAPHTDANISQSYCILFSNVLVCVTLKNQTVSKIRWVVELTSAQSVVSVSNGLSKAQMNKYGVNENCITLRELRITEKAPFTEEFVVNLFPSLKPPYDMGFWFNALESVITSLWFDKKGLLISSNRFRNHMEKKIFSETDWMVMQMGLQPEEYSNKAKIIEDNTPSNHLCYIRHGSVKIKKTNNCGFDVTLATMQQGEFFGEFSYLRADSAPTSADVVAAESGTVICKIPYKKVTSTLLSDPHMMQRFFQLQCCIVANRMTLQHFTFCNKIELSRKRRASHQLLAELSRESLSTSSEELPDAFIGTNNLDDDNDNLRVSRSFSGEMENSPMRKPKPNVLSKKYQAVLPKHIVSKDEHVLFAANFVLRQLEKSDKKMKFVITANHICLLERITLMKSKAKATFIDGENILQFLENQNQLMLVLLAEVEDTKREFCCLFYNLNDYSRIVSLMKNMTQNTDSPHLARRTTSFEKLKNSSHLNNNMDAQLLLTEDDWKQLLEISYEKRFATGEYLISRGFAAATLYIINSGRFEVQLVTGAANPILNHGYLGELTFIQGGVTSAGVVALDDFCSCICFDRTTVDELGKTKPLLVGKFYRMIAVYMTERFLLIQASLL